MTLPITLSIVVPVRDEEESLQPLFDRLGPVLDRLDVPSEVVVVDDGSRDGTRDVLRRIQAGEPRLRVVVLSRSFGQGPALSAGLEASRGRAVALMDADLQDPPELLPPFMDAWRDGAQVVYGVRRTREGGWLRRAAYATFYRLLRRAASIDVPLDAGDFCLLDRRVVDVLVDLPERTRFLRGLRAWVGFRQVAVPYDRPERRTGRTHYSWGGLLELGLDGVLSFSHLPLRLATLAGLGSALLACLGVVFYLTWWAAGFELASRRPQDVGGFTTLVLVQLFAAGLQLLFFGVLGEYLGRVYHEVQGRPAWIVAETWEAADAETSARPASSTASSAPPCRDPDAGT